ncbi:hypothetical protein, partial [Bacteroides heparinolyticus]|uniref:hypothetical protein n=1 Tax=Prevotella heparinolytica TaxID=28113 RepID=UPI00359FB770
LLGILSFTLLHFMACEKSDSEDLSTYEGNVKAFDTQIVDMNRSLEDYIVKSEAAKSANFQKLSVSEVKKIINEYIEAGEKFVMALEKQYELQSHWGAFTKSHAVKTRSEFSCSAYDFIPGTDNGLSPGLVKSIADVIQESKDKQKELEKQYEIDKETDEIKAGANFISGTQKGMLAGAKKTSNIISAAFAGVGASVVTGAALTFVSATVVVTVAASTAVGAVVGAGVMWVCSWWQKDSKTKSNGEGIYCITTGKTTVGGHLPTHMIPEGATVSLHVDGGYAPVVIKNFKYPQAGNERTLDIQLVKTSEVNNSDTKPEICRIDKPFAANSCDDIKFVNGAASPTNPSPGQSVTVTATLMPAIAGCNIHFHIIGTDGYSKEETKVSNSNGQATFYIPGGAEEVFDKVTITSSNGKQYIVTYTF